MRKMSEDIDSDILTKINCPRYNTKNYGMLLFATKIHTAHTQRIKEKQ